ncbi:MAG: hypothetical protein V1756_01520 [Patescibacteria group bacterium]
MKILIAYYSKTTKTEELAFWVKKELEGKGHSVDVEKIKPKKEHSGFIWFFTRIFKKECGIEEPKIKDFSVYDVICIGTPNWTRVAMPVARYLREANNLKNKNIGFFSTTFLPPRLEWYLFSAYLLDTTFSKIIEKKEGRIVADLLLSSAFKKWDAASNFGKKAIKNFCDKVEAPINSLKEYILNQKEIEENRLMIVVLLLFGVFFLVYQAGTSIFGNQALSWGEFLIFFSINVFAYFLFITIIESRKDIFIGKYIAGGLMMLVWTMLMAFLESSREVVIMGYVLFLMAVSFFRNLKAIFFAGSLAILGYVYLFASYSKKEILVPNTDFTLLLLSIGVIGFITTSLQRYFLKLLLAQDEIEEARMTLEIKVTARTSELKELAESLEVKVTERTKELQEKIDELGKFHRLTIGRELKMIELKEEIKKLKEEGKPKL